MPGVTVTARQVDTNASLSVISGDAGQYFVPNLPPGRYEVAAELQGFRIERRTDLVLQLGQELTIDFTLKVEGLQEVVTVGANAPILETTKNTVGTIITNDDIDDLPTVGRDFSSLARRAPGVMPGVGGNGDSLSMNGQRGFSNGFFIDGATAEWQYYGKQSSTMVQDWIQEFQVMTNSFSAEFGTASGRRQHQVRERGLFAQGPAVRSHPHLEERGDLTLRRAAHAGAVPMEERALECPIRFPRRHRTTKGASSGAPRPIRST